MPCEACNTQFTVLKWKRPCKECRRLYCGNCLTRCGDRLLCARCVIFNKRPLTKIELLKLKAKDLIYYLQSKKISTTGCVEKEELVNLVLIHVNNYSPDSQSSGRNQYENNEDRSNPFKSTCQNIFATITEIAADLNFDMKPAPSDGQPPNIFAQQPRRSSSQSRNGQPSYYHPGAAPQPPPRQHPAHLNASSPPAPPAPPGQSSSSGSNASSASPTSPMQGHHHLQSPTTSTSETSSMRRAAAASAQSKDSTNSAVKAHSGAGARGTASLISPTAPNEVGQSASATLSVIRQNAKSDRSRAERVANKKRLHVDHHLIDACGNASGCDCSDDEMITNFQKQYSRSNSAAMPNAACGDQEAGPSGSASSSVNTAANSRSPPNQAGLGSDDSSDVSSFEDLGASGAALLGGNASIDAETWQIINRVPESSSPVGLTDRPYDDASSSGAMPEQLKTSAAGTPATIADAAAANDPDVPRLTPPDITCTLVNDDTGAASRPPTQDVNNTNHTFQGHSSHETDAFNQLYSAIPKLKPNRKISRRRSDGIVYRATTRHNLLDDDDDSILPEDAETDDADESGGAYDRPSRQRPRKSCHKCGKTKGDIRKHIERFRKQLETTTDANEAEIKQQLEEFLDFLESHSRNSIDDGIDGGPDEVLQQHSEGIDSSTDGVTYGEDDDEYEFDEDAGIHVYATNADSASVQAPRQFVNIGDYETMESIEALTVKQLKEILMLNRIDFKGCCEKTELLERVQRLWQDMQNCPSVEKLTTDDLCKICMDAPIECVLLECGHMATCTGCGKVLSECPICRQYIVRVVRFFKA